MLNKFTFIAYDVETTDTFDAWFELQSRALKEDMLATMLILSEFAPQLGRRMLIR